MEITCYRHVIEMHRQSCFTNQTYLPLTRQSQIPLIFNSPCHLLINNFFLEIPGTISLSIFSSDFTHATSIPIRLKIHVSHYTHFSTGKHFFFFHVHENNKK